LLQRTRHSSTSQKMQAHLSLCNGMRILTISKVAGNTSNHAVSSVAARTRWSILYRTIGALGRRITSSSSATLRMARHYNQITVSSNLPDACVRKYTQTFYSSRQAKHGRCDWTVFFHGYSGTGSCYRCGNTNPCTSHPCVKLKSSSHPP